MRKLFKKSLACILTAIICVSLCVVAVPASAATPTYSTNAVEAKAGETVAIDFTVSNFTDVQGAIIEFSLPSVVASISDVKLNGEAIDVYDAETGAGCYQVSGNSIKFLSLFGLDGEPAARDTLVFNITAVIADDAAEGTYTYPAPEFQIAQSGAIVDVTGSFGTFTIIPSVVEDVNIKTTGTIVVSETLGISYVITGVDAYDDFELVVTKNAYSTTNYNVVATPVTMKKSEMTYYKGAYYATVYGFALTDLCLNVESVINCYNDDALVAYSAGYDTTIKALAVALYNSTTAVATKTVLTDLLNMGSEAMGYFAGRYTSSDLANVAAEDYPNYGFSQTYATAEVPELTLGAGQTSNTGATISCVGTILQSPAFAYVIKPTATASNLNVEISYYDAYKKTTTTSTATAADMTLYKGSYYYNFATLPLYASNAVVTITVKDGTTVLGTQTYTVEQSVSESAAATLSVYNSIAKFGASARAYFKIG